MFQTKKDVDKHVRSSLSKLRDNEKNLRGYTIAKLYYKIGEYNTAVHYVSMYLSANDNSAAAHKFLGQCYEKLKKPDKQLAAYQRSLELDKKQTDLLIEICKLLQMDELGVSTAKARYWYEFAESRNIQDDAVFNLKLKYLTENNEGGTSKNVQELILKEIVQRPLDIGLRIRLIRHFLDQNKIDDAFKYAYEIEMKHNGNFRNSSDWYLTVSQVLASYKSVNEASLHRNWTYWLLLICTLEHQVYLSLLQSSNDSVATAQNLTEATNYLFQFDQNLNRAAGLNNICPESERELMSQFLYHFRGQLCLHAATLLFKRELSATPRNHWHETGKVALPLLLLAYNCGRIDIAQPWLKNATENTKQLMRQWHSESCFRLSQASRTLLSCVDTKATNDNAVLANLRKICTEKYSIWATKDDVLNEIRRCTTDSDWRKRVYRQLFTSNDHMSAATSSYLYKCAALQTPTYEWPQVSDLETDEEISQDMEPSSLSHLVYLALGYDATSTSKSSNLMSISPDVRCRVFKDLHYSVQNLTNCGAETLNQLDIETFLYAAAIQAKRSIDVEKSYLTSNVSNAPGIVYKPKVLPYANMAHRLCTEDQASWWTAAYKVYNNISGDELVELRTTLQNGIEVVRGVGAPRMDLIILLKLGQIFNQRSQESTKTVERGFLEARTEALFKYSLYMLRMQDSSRSIEPFRRLFKYAVGNNQFEIDTEVNKLAEEAITFLASRYFKNNEFEECIEDMAGIRLPFATYFQAESYRKLIEVSNTPKKNKRTYLEKAKDCLAQTLDLLDAPNVDRNHPLKSIVDADLKRLQIESRKLETNQSLSDSFVSANGLDESTSRFIRTTPTTVVQNNGNLERMIREMMESLSLLKEDMSDVCTRVRNIEDQLSKQNQDTGSVDPLNDYYLLDDEAQQGDSTYLNNTSMYTNVSRLHTPSHQPANAFVNQQYNAQYAPSAGNVGLPYNMSQLCNGIYPPGVNAYQAAMLNAATNQANRTPTQMQMPNFASPVQYPYGSDPLGVNYNLQQQYPTVSLANRSLSGMLHQPVSQPSSMLQMQSQSQIYSLPQNQAIVSLPTASVASVVVTSASVAGQASASNLPTLAMPKQWSAALNNAPVEKEPPVNVVITSSDPLPSQNTASLSTQSGQALSVTIPPQHIKNNNLGATQAQLPLSASKANPVITAALQDVKTPPKASTKVDKVEKDAKSSTPSLAEQKSIFDNANKTVSSTPLSSPAASIFGSTKAATKTDTPKSEAGKVNPFASFSFTKSTPEVGASTEPPKPAFSFGFNQTALASKSEQSQPATTASPVKPTEAANVSKEDEDDYVPTAQFEPVISLPDLVEVKTGEENETVLFEHRAKLLRYVKESKEWKERGIGNMKVLVNKDDPNKVRLLMRREQVLKLCCNQLLAKDTKFNMLPKSNNAMSWFGQDYSENELQVEMFAIRFKTAEICTRFHNAILEAQKNMTGAAEKPNEPVKKTEKLPQKGFGDQFKPKAGSWTCEGCYVTNKESDKKCVACNTPKDKDAPAEESSQTAAPKSIFSFGNLGAAASKPISTTTSTKPADSTVKGFGDKFKPKPGSWSCSACYTSNTADTLYCVACEAPKDDTVPKKEAQNTFSSSVTPSKFSFGNLPAAGGQNVPASTTANIFGSSNTDSTSSFGGFNFGTKPATTPTTTQPVNIATPKMESSEFGFVFKPKSPGKPKSPLKSRNDSTGGIENVSDDENVIEEENNTYFTPVIPLPEKIDVKTGEEDETVLYSHRAKLFRFRDSEWRERGLGDVKILQHNQTGVMRVVMRREKILKICLNHALTHDIEYKTKDPKSWFFVVNDFSEGQLELDQFSLRFKNEEVAKEFKQAIDDALSGTTSKQNGGPHPGEIQSAPATQSKQSSDDKKLVADLKLPQNFFEYKNKAECTGCRGCTSEEFVFPEVKAINLGVVDDNPLPLAPPAKPQIVAQKSEPPATATNAFSFSSIFKNSFSSPKPDVTVTTASDATVPSFSFGQKTVFGQPAQSPLSAANATVPTSTSDSPGNNAFVKPSLFSFNLGTSTTSTTTTTNSTSSFSFNGATKTSTTEEKVESKPLFGSSNVFGSATSTNTPPTNIFGGFGGFGAAKAGNTENEKPKEATGSIFGGFGGFGAKKPSDADSKESKEPASTVFGSFSFGKGDNAQQPAETAKFSFGLPATTTVSSDSPINMSTIKTTSTPVSDTIEQPTLNTPSDLSFGALAAKANSENSVDSTLKMESGLSFAALAQSSAATNSSFNTSANTSTGFVGLSRKDDFSNFMGRPQGNLNGSTGNANAEHADTENADDPNYDPHYDPIIALPDEIQLSTGEEEETKLFGERAKLFRYDTTNKEWKERGVGEVKVLHHPKHNSYRLLLRREQIHKLVLNMALSTDFQMTPMKQSDKAFCWVSTNFAEDSENGALESLSVRFKNADLAQKFHNVVQNSIDQLKLRSELEPEED